MPHKSELFGRALKREYDEYLELPQLPGSIEVKLVGCHESLIMVISRGAMLLFINTQPCSSKLMLINQALSQKHSLSQRQFHHPVGTTPHKLYQQT